jgi:hypothetical protein
MVEIGGYADPATAEANARLIAAAPELLAVAKNAANLSTGQDCDPAHLVLVVEAMEALTKALGPDWQNVPDVERREPAPLPSDG